MGPDATPGSGMPKVPAHGSVPTLANWNCAMQCAYSISFCCAVMVAKSTWSPSAASSLVS